MEEEFEKIPGSVVDKTKRCFLDTLACSFGGSQTQVGKMMIRLATAMNSDGTSSILGTGHTGAPPIVAMTNSATANMLDYDDTLAGHPGATISPSALAVGEGLGVSGKELISSIVVGYEVSTRIGIAIQPSPDRFNQVWGIGTWQVFGAAAAAGRLLNLDEEQMISAFGIAGANAPVASCMKTVLGPLGEVSMIKNNFAMSSFAGVTAALLAKDGFVGPRDILDGDEGFWVMAGSDQCDFGLMTEGLGTRYRVLDVAFKPYPACRWLHATIDAGLGIVAEHRFAVGDIERVKVRTNSILTKRPYDRARPSNMMQAQFSVPYSLAVAMSGVKIGPKWFAPQTLGNSSILGLAGKVEIEPYDEADRLGRIDDVLSNVEVQVNGQSYSKEVRYPIGHSKNPFRIDQRELKFLSLTSPVLGVAPAKQLMGHVERLEEISNINKLSRIFHKSRSLTKPATREIKGKT